MRFYVAGALTVFVDKANGLLLPSSDSITAKNERFDPYVQLTLDGKAVQTTKRTPADKDGGRDPVWQNNVTFSVVDQYVMDVKVIFLVDFVPLMLMLDFFPICSLRQCAA